MKPIKNWTLVAVVALLALHGPVHGADPAKGAPLPPANFLVEWRIQPIGIARSGAVVITSSSAANGGESGYGAGAVVVGTARPRAPQALRVVNGKEGAIAFDDSQSHQVYEMSYSAESSAQSDTDATASAGNASNGGASHSRSQSKDRGTSGHEVVVHRVDGLRVTPHWRVGDTLELDVALTHRAPTDDGGGSGYGSRAARDIDFHSTVELSFDDWQTVASVGDGGEELQIRVSWR